MFCCSAGHKLKDKTVLAKLSAPPHAYWPLFQSVVVKLLKALYDRHSARPLCSPNTWCGAPFQPPPLLS